MHPVGRSVPGKQFQPTAANISYDLLEIIHHCGNGRGTLMLSKPLVFQNAVDQEVPPGALQPLRLTLSTLVAHPDLLHDPRRSAVVRMAMSCNAVQSRGLKGNRKQRRACLRRNPSTPVISM